MKHTMTAKKNDLYFDHRRFVLEFVERFIDFLFFLLLSGNMVSKVVYEYLVELLSVLNEQFNMQLHHAAARRALAS